MGGSGLIRTELLISYKSPLGTFIALSNFVLVMGLEILTCDSYLSLLIKKKHGSNFNEDCKVRVPEKQVLMKLWCYVKSWVRSSHRRCSVRKGGLRKFAKFTGRKTLVPESLF